MTQNVDARPEPHDLMIIIIVTVIVIVIVISAVVAGSNGSTPVDINVCTRCVYRGARALFMVMNHDE